MKRSLVLAVFVCSASLGLTALSETVRAEGNYDAQWIWIGDGARARGSDGETVWFRREVRAAEPSTGAVRILCDDHFVLWVNGRRIGAGGGEKLYRFNLNGIVGRGLNTVAVEAVNRDGKAGLFVDGEIRGQSGQKTAFDTGPEWRATAAAPAGEAWRRSGFDDGQWQGVKLLGPHGESPWKSIALKETYLDRYQLAPGFEIQRIAEPELVGTLIAMATGRRGRLMAAVEKGPILSVIDEDGDGVYDKSVKFSTDVQNCQGLCTVFADVYAVGEGPNGVGIYRLRDEDDDDVADQVEHVFTFNGKIVDHGPHAVVFGPDGWMYTNMGNHAWVTATPQPTTAARDAYEGDLLRPRFEDGRGHAAGIKVPGGTIWRFSPDGKKWWCETAGFRNEYDFALNAHGEMFSFDSDMEWDVGLPWYRPVRVNHCIPGAEFGWRSGAAKWPAYYFDSLPGTVDVGRGSPTGVVFYDHRQFPEEYRGAFLVCDWSVGRILAISLKQSGSTFAGTAMPLVTGNPLNVSDIEVDRDGSMIFSTGGRGTEGGIYRVTYRDGNAAPANAETVEQALSLEQPQTAWAREILVRVQQSAGPEWERKLVDAARKGDAEQQIRALTLLSQYGPKPPVALLTELVTDDDAAVRSFVAHLLGDHTGQPVEEALSSLLEDSDAAVQRRACEAFVRSGIQAPVRPLIKLLGSDDRWLRFAARLALERVPADEWKLRVLESSNPHVVTHGLLALWRLKSDDPSPDDALVLESQILDGARGELNGEQKLEVLRMIELSLLTGGAGSGRDKIVRTLLDQFPTGGADYDAEAARILAVSQHPDVARALVAHMERAAERTEQMHCALCLRYVKTGWDFDLKRRLLEWYDGTRDWEGGHSFVPYLANIVGASLERFDAQERRRILDSWADFPYAAGLLLSNSRPDQIDGFDQVLSAILSDEENGGRTGRDELITLAVEALGKSTTPESRRMLYDLYERYPDRRELLARAMSLQPVGDDWPLLVRTLQFADTTTLQLCLAALQKIDRKPERSEEIRSAILAGLKLGDQGGRVAAGLLARWTGEAADSGESIADSLARYQDWYASQFPDAPRAELPREDLDAVKYSFDTLHEYLEQNPQGQNGDVDRGRAVFAKTKCLKCHRFRNEGENVGPDLTTLRRRFQRKEIIESLLFPSQVISDQYRMVQVATENGQVHVGMPIPSATNSERLMLLLPDATQLAIPRDEIAEQIRSKTSVMPVGLLKDLTLEEIADLFAFLETSRSMPDPAAAASAQGD